MLVSALASSCITVTAAPIVLVAGEPVVRDGAHTGARPGREAPLGRGAGAPGGAPGPSLPNCTTMLADTLRSGGTSLAPLPGALDAVAGLTPRH